MNIHQRKEDTQNSQTKKEQKKCYKNLAQKRTRVNQNPSSSFSSPPNVPNVLGRGVFVELADGQVVRFSIKYSARGEI